MATYDAAHEQERARWAPTVAAGRASCTEPVCLLPSRRIRPGAPWDLAHNRRTGQWRGPAHRRCNRSEGALFGLRKRGIAPGWRPPKPARGSTNWTPSRDW